VFFDGVHSDDIGMGQPAGGTGFSYESAAKMRLGCKICGKQLDGDESIESDVSREKDDTHSAAAELAIKGITPRDHSLKIEKFA